MTDRTTSDLAALLTPPPSAGVQFSQGRVLSWNNETLSNTIEWRGITIRDVPLVEGINALVIREGDIVGMLGWAPENAKGVGSWWIIGKLSNPGEFVADLNITAKIFRFVTEQGYTLAFFGKEADGDPFWSLNYGGADGRAVMRIRDGNSFAILDRSGNEIVGSDGLTQVGLSRPWIPYHMAVAGPAQISGTSFWPTTPNNVFTEIFVGVNPVFHPRVSFAVGTATAGGGNAEWELRANGTTILTSSGVGNIPGWGTSINPGDDVTFQLYGRIAGGGSRAFFQVTRFYGRQS